MQSQTSLNTLMMKKKVKVSLTITYDPVTKEVKGHQFNGKYTLDELSTIVPTFRKCLEEWGYQVKRA